MDPNATPLNELRRAIDEIDSRLAELLNERARLAIKIGRAKSQMGAPLVAPEREVQVLERVAQESRGPLRQDDLRRIFEAIIAASAALERDPPPSMNDRQ
jgi:chorismate mutase-like protein